MTVNEYNTNNKDSVSEYMLKHFARYVNDWYLVIDDAWCPEAEAMLHCIHDGYNYREGLIQGFNTDEEFAFFDRYNLLKDKFTEIKVGKLTYKIRYFKKDFVDTFTNEDWYFESLREVEEDETYGF